MQSVINAAGEMVRRDDQAAVQVEPMGVSTLDPNAGIEMKLIAAETLRFFAQPFQQRPAMSSAPGLRTSREIVDIEAMAPGKGVDDPEASHGDGLRIAFLEGADEPVSLRPLNLVDLARKRLLVSKSGPQRPHRGEPKVRVGRKQLSNHRPILNFEPDGDQRTAGQSRA